jgi:hypothetical protein
LKPYRKASCIKNTSMATLSVLYWPKPKAWITTVLLEDWFNCFIPDAEKYQRGNVSIPDSSYLW